MEEQRFTCNDCGCVFEYRILERKTPVIEKDEKEKAKTGQRRVMCPECESFNITTA